MLQGLVVVPETQQHRAEVAPRVSVCGGDLDGLLHRLQRELALAHALVGDAYRGPGVGVGRLQLHSPLEPDDGLVVLAQFAVGDAEVLVKNVFKAPARA
jgi:hypothetical protein